MPALLSLVVLPFVPDTPRFLLLVRGDREGAITGIRHNIIYVAAKATFYIRLLHGKIGLFGFFFGPSSVKRGRTHIVLG